MNVELCCGCVVEQDYGTGILTGAGLVNNPYKLEQVDPTFKRPVVKVGILPGTNQTIANNTPIPLLYDAEYFDPGNMWIVGQTRLSVAVAGLYLMGFSGSWAANSGPKEFYFRKNGSIDISRKTAHSTSSLNYRINMTAMTYFDTEDFLEVVAFQTTGSDLNVMSETGYPLYCWMMYLGRRV